MKIINFLFLIIFLFQSTPTFSMNGDYPEGLDEIALIFLKAKVPDTVSTPLATEDKKKERTRLKNSGDQEYTDRSGCCRSDDDCCIHWGLKRWIYGIKEYIIDRCLCCAMCGFNPMDKDRAYQRDEYTSDCSCVVLSCCNNPITGTLCFPLVATIHLLSLPCACCSPNKDEYYGTDSPGKISRDARYETNNLHYGLDDETHLKNCDGKSGTIWDSNVCNHPAHKGVIGVRDKDWSGKLAWHGAPDTTYYNSIVYNNASYNIMYSNQNFQRNF
jgi:hypothetical protein